MALDGKANVNPIRNIGIGIINESSPVLQYLSLDPFLHSIIH